MEAFLVSAGLVAIAEIGDKTQIATVALAARFHSIALVTAGTTIGMLLANVPAVLFGDVLARKLPLGIIRACAATAFTVLGVLVLLKVDFGLNF